MLGYDLGRAEQIFKRLPSENPKLPSGQYKTIGLAPNGPWGQSYSFVVAPYLDRKPAFWKSGSMKTTLDLPDELMREVKIRAVHEDKKLKDAIAEFIRKGMGVSTTRPPKIPKPVKLRGGFEPTTEDIEAAIAWGRD